MLEEQIKTYVTSLIRTVTPVVVGNLIGWLVTLGVPLPEEVSASLSGLIILTMGALFTIAYYAGIRRLEMRWPAFGIFLGKAKAPLGYSATPEQDKRTIGIALEATRDRAPDEDGEAVDSLLVGEIAEPPYVARHRAGGRHADGEPV